MDKYDYVYSISGIKLHVPKNMTYPSSSNWEYENGYLKFGNIWKYKQNTTNPSVEVGMLGKMCTIKLLPTIKYLNKELYNLQDVCDLLNATQLEDVWNVYTRRAFLDNDYSIRFVPMVWRSCICATQIASLIPTPPTPTTHTI